MSIAKNPYLKGTPNFDTIGNAVQQAELRVGGICYVQGMVKANQYVEIDVVSKVEFLGLQLITPSCLP